MRILWSALACAFLGLSAPSAAAQDIRTDDFSMRRASTCVMWGPDRVDCFVRGRDNSMHHRWRNGDAWGGFEQLGGQLTSAIGCVAPAPNQIHCLVNGRDSAIWRRSWTGGPSWGPGGPLTEGWGSAGGGNGTEPGGNPSCVVISANRFDCFTVDRERVATRRTFEDGRWAGGWQRLTGFFLPRGRSPTCVMADDPAAISVVSPDRLTPIWCFARGEDNALWMARVPTAAIGSTPPVWTSLGGVMTTEPSCVATDLMRVQCFVRGTDNALYSQTITPAGGNGWRSMGGVVTSEPQCISRNERRIDCFVRGTDNALYHNAGTPSGTAADPWRWAGWQSWGGDLRSGPNCVTYRDRLRGPTAGDGRIDCFALGTDEALWQIASVPTGRTAWRSLGGNVWMPPS